MCCVPRWPVPMALFPDLASRWEAVKRRKLPVSLVYCTLTGTKVLGTIASSCRYRAREKE